MKNTEKTSAVKVKTTNLNDLYLLYISQANDLQEMYLTNTKRYDVVVVLVASAIFFDSHTIVSREEIVIVFANLLKIVTGLIIFLEIINLKYNSIYYNKLANAVRNLSFEIRASEIPELVSDSSNFEERASALKDLDLRLKRRHDHIMEIERKGRHQVFNTLSTIKFILLILSILSLVSIRLYDEEFYSIISSLWK